MNTIRNCGKILILAMGMILILGTEARGADWVICVPPSDMPPEVIPPNPPVVPPGGAGLPVFDEANTFVNTITATRMGQQVINSERQIALQKQDLTRTGGCWENTGR